MQNHAVITGGSQGIGAALVKKFLNQNFTVTIFDKQPPSWEIIDTDRLRFVPVDLSSLEEIQSVCTALEQTLKEKKETLRVLINNAGITRDRLAARVTTDDWDAVMNINVRSAFFLSQRLLRFMSAQKAQTACYLIMMSSVVAHTGNAGQAVYAASKAALIALAKSLAQEYASRAILINAIAPGFVESPMTNLLSEEYKKKVCDQTLLKRSAQPEEIAELVYFLCSGKADYITGQCIDSNGGLYLR